MLTIIGSPKRKQFCDRFSRRDFLQIGGLGLGGLALPELLRAESALSLKNSRKAVIMIFMTGGPPHQDMYDLKMDAPPEIRGPFQPNTVQRTWDKLPACHYLVQAMAKLRYRLTSWKLIPRSLNGIAFKPIAARVAGIQICEHLPRIAAMMDKFVPIRSVVGSDGGHSQYQCTTGWSPKKPPALALDSQRSSKRSGPVV